MPLYFSKRILKNSSQLFGLYLLNIFKNKKEIKKRR